jgi:hypothetical protein
MLNLVQSHLPSEAPRVDVEYEMETEPLSKEMLASW